MSTVELIRTVLQSMSIDNVTRLLPYLPNFGTNYKPILAFWKAESVAEQIGQVLPPLPPLPSPPASPCSAFTTPAQQQECESLRVRQNTYTLVVYLQSTGEGGEWKGKSRIRRYQLRKYTTMATLTQSTGYVEPSQTNTSFQQWPLDSTSATLAPLQSPLLSLSSGSASALVDFVDNPIYTGTPPNSLGVLSCPAGYTRTPAISPPPTPNTSTSFFACVRNEANSAGLNQDVIVFLRGNPVGKPGIFTVTDNQLPSLQSQVIARGVLDKTPPQ